MLAYHDPGVRDFFRTPHNDYLQALCDGGVLVGVPLLATLGVLAVRVVRGVAEPLDSRSLRNGPGTARPSAWRPWRARSWSTSVCKTPANAVLFAVLASYAAGPDREAQRSAARRLESAPAEPSARTHAWYAQRRHEQQMPLDSTQVFFAPHAVP